MDGTQKECHRERLCRDRASDHDEFLDRFDRDDVEVLVILHEVVYGVDHVEGDDTADNRFFIFVAGSDIELLIVVEGHHDTFSKNVNKLQVFGNFAECQGMAV